MMNINQARHLPLMLATITAAAVSVLWFIYELTDSLSRLPENYISFPGTYQRCCPLKVPALSTFCSLLLFAFHGPRVDGWRSISVSAWWWLRRPLIAAVADVAPWGASSDSHWGLNFFLLDRSCVSQAVDS